MGKSQPVIPKSTSRIICRDSDLATSHNSSNMTSTHTAEITYEDLIFKIVKGVPCTSEGTLIPSMFIQHFIGRNVTPFMLFR